MFFVRVMSKLPTRSARWKYHLGTIQNPSSEDPKEWESIYLECLRLVWPKGVPEFLPKSSEEAETKIQWEILKDIHNMRLLTSSDSELAILLDSILPKSILDREAITEMIYRVLLVHFHIHSTMYIQSMPDFLLVLLFVFLADGEYDITNEKGVSSLERALFFCFLSLAEAVSDVFRMGSKSAGVVDEILRVVDPELYAWMVNVLSVESFTYVVPWHMALYTRTLPWKHVLDVWDLVVCSERRTRTLALISSAMVVTIRDRILQEKDSGTLVNTLLKYEITDEYGFANCLQKYAELEALLTTDEQGQKVLSEL